jgi:hypothetical protein
MGIDIYAKWDGITEAEEAAQMKAWASVEDGDIGYLREAYHGEPYATRRLVPEAFMYGRAKISAVSLRQRLQETLEVAERRERKLYGATNVEDIEHVLKSYRDFVALCAQKEFETGQPCLIIASF